MKISKKQLEKVIREELLALVVEARNKGKSIDENWLLKQELKKLGVKRAVRWIITKIKGPKPRRLSKPARSPKKPAKKPQRSSDSTIDQRGSTASGSGRSGSTQPGPPSPRQGSTKSMDAAQPSINKGVKFGPQPGHRPLIRPPKSTPKAPKKPKNGSSSGHSNGSTISSPPPTPKK